MYRANLYKQLFCVFNKDVEHQEKIEKIDGE